MVAPLIGLTSRQQAAFPAQQAAEHTDPFPCPFPRSRVRYQTLLPAREISTPLGNLVLVAALVRARLTSSEGAQVAARFCRAAVTKLGSEGFKVFFPRFYLLDVACR